MGQATLPTLEPRALTDSLQCCVAGRPGPSRTLHQARANPGRRAETLPAVCTHVPSPRPARAEAAARLQCESGPNGLTGSAEGGQGLGGSCAESSAPAGCSEEKEEPVSQTSPIQATPVPAAKLPALRPLGVPGPFVTLPQTLGNLIQTLLSLAA